MPKQMSTQKASSVFIVDHLLRQSHAICYFITLDLSQKNLDKSTPDCDTGNNSPIVSVSMLLLYKLYYRTQTNVVQRTRIYSGA